MSRLEELIQELCPNGVEYKQLKDILIIKNGRDYKKFGDGEIPVYGSGGIMTYIDTAIYTQPSVLIPRKGSLDKLYYVDEPFWNVDTIFYTEINLEQVVPKYVYYCLQMQHLERLNKAGGVPSLTQSVLNKVKIPVPPLEVQREIVRILDNFTELTAELQKELTAELTARKKQYEFYRDQLFEFDESIPHIQLKDLAKIDIGLATSVTQHKCDNGVILIHNSDIQQNVIRLKSIEFISEDFAKKHEKKRLRKGDIITVHTGDVGTSAVIGDQFDGAIGFTTITTRIQDKEIINEFYLCHYFNSYRCKKDISLMTISDRSNLNQKSFEKLLIPVPSIEQQRCIVTILNRFDVICNDLKNGLPAEVEARKKQYEYYRDTLLNFERLEE